MKAFKTLQFYSLQINLNTFTKRIGTNRNQRRRVVDGVKYFFSHFLSWCLVTKTAMESFSKV